MAASYAASPLRAASSPHIPNRSGQWSADFDPKAARPTASPGETVEHLHAQRVAIEAGPMERNGALGAMTSVYCRDPDGNLLELATYHSSGGTWPPFGKSAS